MPPLNSIGSVPPKKLWKNNFILMHTKITTRICGKLTHPLNSMCCQVFIVGTKKITTRICGKLTPPLNFMCCQVFIVGTTFGGN